MWSMAAPQNATGLVGSNGVEQQAKETSMLPLINRPGAL
jgi:hypothetical protein